MNEDFIQGRLMITETKTIYKCGYCNKLYQIKNFAIRHERECGPCFQISFEGYNSNAQKGPIGWQRLETYGARLFENVTQAVACDIQAEGLKRCESRGYPIVMHTHDEGTAEVPVGHGSVEEMATIMSERPAWASWWPIKAAGWEHKRFQKD